MDQLKADVARIGGEVVRLGAEVDRISKAIYGDRDALREQPGVIFELSRLEEGQKQTNAILSEMRGDIRRLFWILISAVVTAAASSVVAFVFSK